MNSKAQKTIYIILVICFVMGTLGASGTALASAGTFQTTGSVNIRSEPSSNGSVVGSVSSGANVEVLEHNPAGWSRVNANGVSGFIRSDFLRVPTGETPAAFRTTGSVNVRESASIDSNIVTNVSAGVSVDVTEHNPAGWSSVSVNGVTGFIRSDFLTRGGSPESAATTETSTGNSTEAAIAVLKTSGTINLRSGPSTNNSVLRTLAPNTSVEVIENQSNGWSRVRVNGTAGFIRTDLISGSDSSRTVSSSVGTLYTLTGVNLRAGPSTSHNIIRLLVVNTAVEVLENQANGWSRVRHNGTTGFIRSDLLGTVTSTIEIIDWSTARNIIPTGVTLRVVDVRTGISFNMRGLAKNGHVDIEPLTQEDTDAIFRTRNGVWSWSPRPVWVTVGNRTFAAALNGMPHDVSTIATNGMNGHLCMHFHNTVANSQSYQSELRGAVLEAYNARPQ